MVARSIGWPKSLGRTTSSIHRILAEERSKRLLEDPIDYMDSPEFHKPDCRACHSRTRRRKSTRSINESSRLRDCPHTWRGLYATPLLTREEEGYYFRKLNFLKYLAAKLSKKFEKQRPKAADLDRLEELLARATEVKNFLIREQSATGCLDCEASHESSNQISFEMVSDGNMSLIRAIEKFDYTKGNKFSTYASWAIMKNYARSIPREFKILDRFRTGHDEVFDSSPEDRDSPLAEERIHTAQQNVVTSILDQLEERERSIIVHRFGLEEGTEPQTLEAVGKEFGVTKERIRQIESRALLKLRKIAHEEKLEIPGI